MNFWSKTFSFKRCTRIPVWPEFAFQFQFRLKMVQFRLEFIRF